MLGGVVDKLGLIADAQFFQPSRLVGTDSLVRQVPLRCDVCDGLPGYDRTAALLANIATGNTPETRRAGSRATSTRRDPSTARLSPDDYRHTTTGILECVSTCTVSLPKTSAANPLCPCDAMQIASQSLSSAASMIAAYGCSANTCIAS